MALCGVRTAQANIGYGSCQTSNGLLFVKDSALGSFQRPPGFASQLKAIVGEFLGTKPSKKRSNGAQKSSTPLRSAARAWRVFEGYLIVFLRF